VRALLAERQPAAAAALRAMERQIDQELSHGTARPRRVHDGRRPHMNTSWLYHLDSSACVDGWSCQEQAHTSVPPRCGDRAAGEVVGCELPKGHPGPHPVSTASLAGEVEVGVGDRLLAADNRKGDRDRHPCGAGGR
jgi:hypothetical protein